MMVTQILSAKADSLKGPLVLTHLLDADSVQAHHTESSKQFDDHSRLT